MSKLLPRLEGGAGGGMSDSCFRNSEGPIRFDRMTAADDLLSSIRGKFGTILADPPWRFQNSTGKVCT